MQYIYYRYYRYADIYACDIYIYCTYAYLMNMFMQFNQCESKA